MSYPRFKQIQQTVDFIIHPVFVFNYGSQFGLTPNMNWSDAANWDVGSVPTPDARVVINNYFPDNTSLGSNRLYRLDISGGTLTTSNMLITNLNVSGGTLAAGVINLPASGIFNWSGGLITGAFNVPTGATLNLSGAGDKTIGLLGAPGVILNNGRVNWNGGNLLASSGSVINNNGAFVLQSSGQFNNYTGASPSPAFNNNGLLEKTNSNGETVFTPDIGGWVLNQNGAIDIENGALSLQSHLNVNGGASFAGPGVTRVDAGVIFINGTNTIQPGATLELAGGTWNGTNVFAGSGAFVWSGGALSAANISLQSNVAFKLSGANLKTLGDFNGPGVISSAGPGTWTGTGIVNAGLGSVINNDGIFTVLNDSSFVNYTGSLPLPVFINNGSLVKTNSSGTNTTFFGADPDGGMAFNNNGSVNVRSGTISLGGGGAGTSGAFTAASGSHINFASGVFSLAGSPSFLGAGSTRVNGGSLTFGDSISTMTAGGTFEVASGNLHGTNTFAGSGAFVWSGGLIARASISLQTNAAFNLAGTNTKTLGDFSGPGVINSAGPGSWTGAGIVNASVGSSISNSGTFTVQNDSSFINYTGSPPVPVFVNTGTFRKNTTTGTTLFAPDNGGVNFNNSGTVDLQTGTLASNGGYSLSGSPQLHLALGGPNPGTQFGQETFANSTTLGGALTVTLANGFSPTNGQSFPLVTYASESGQFVSQQLPVLPINLAWQVAYGATAFTLNVVPASGSIITNVIRLANGHFQFSVTGPTRTLAIVQASTNLLDWTFLQTNAPFTGSMLFEDPQAAGYPARFYRLLMQP